MKAEPSEDRAEGGPQGAQGAFLRGPAYRSLRGLAGRSRGAGGGEVPSVASLPPGTKRGYLWRLSGRRMLYRTDWKRKYFVLQQDRLYYYETERGKAGERGSGLIELKYFMDCVEAPLTDHKKATNVFLLLAAERGFFDQGRCYLSAETLIDMKDWVGRIRGALESLQGRGPAPASLPPALEPGAARCPPVRRDAGPSEPLYASIREESIHRSNSLSTLPSLCRGDTLLGEAEDWHNRSMDEGPVCGLGGVDHNLTYNYSSSEESLNESFSIVIGQKPPRSADSSMRRGPLQARARPEITLQPHEPAYAAYEEVGGGACSTFPRHSSPAKRSAASVKSSSDYLARMYSEMARVDEQLEMVSRVETDGGSVSEAGSPAPSRGSSGPSRGSPGASRAASQATVRGGRGSQGSLHKMEQMLKQVVRQSEELYGVFRQLETESQGGREQLPGALGARLARYQGSLVALERQATDLMVEIKETHNRVVQSLEEAEQARRDFIQLKERAEFILGQLQGEAARHPPAMAPRPFSQYEPVAASQTFPKQKGPAAARAAPQSPETASGRGRVAFCQDPLHPAEPVYAQPVKKADREKEKPEAAGGYAKPSYEAPGQEAARGSPGARRYSTYSPRGPRGPLAGDERWSPARRPGEPGPRSPLAQEERCSPGPEEAVSPAGRSTGAQVIYAHRKELAGQETRPGLQAQQPGSRPRSLFLQPAKRD